jgi:uncharacterized tellurite resistance protein B-like protein
LPLVAKEDEVTDQERDQIRIFLEANVSYASVDSYLRMFDSFIGNLAPKTGDITTEVTNVDELCQQINSDLTQKQKIVIVVEILNIIQADGSISDRENELVDTIGKNFKITTKELAAIKTFVLGQEGTQLDHSQILIIDSSPARLFLHHTASTEVI